MLYWLPAIAIVAVGPLAIGSGWRAVVWTVALATMGMACIVNAFRCGRVHCYLTGPFFILMALVALSYGLGILHLGGKGWNLLGVITIVGTIALWCLPEMFWEDIGRAARIIATLAEWFLPVCPSSGRHERPRHLNARASELNCRECVVRRAWRYGWNSMSVE
jgi:hypothetical protein